jgi:hypothetical protein
MGTRATATAKKQEEAPSGDVKALAAGITNPDGTINLDKVRELSVAMVGKEKAEEVETAMVQSHAPDGLIETFTATWDAGWEGKLHTFCSAVGAIVVVGLLAEAAGALLDIPQIRVISMVSRKWLGD